MLLLMAELVTSVLLNFYNNVVEVVSWIKYTKSVLQ